MPKETGWSPKEKRLWGGGAPVRFRDPPASPTRVGGATRPLRCPLRGLISSLAPRARGSGWQKSSPVKVFCPAFLQKSGRGPGAEPWPRAAARGTLLVLTKRRRGSKGEPSPGVPPLRAAPAARSRCNAVARVVNARRAGVEPRPYRGLEDRGGVSGGRRKGSSGTPTPTVGGKRAVCRGIYCDIIPRPGGGRRNGVRPAVTMTAGRRGRRPLQGGCDAVRSAVDSRRAGMEPRTYDKKTPPQMWRRFSVTYWIAICLFSGTSSGRFGSVRVSTPSLYAALMAEVSMPETSKLRVKLP